MARFGLDIRLQYSIKYSRERERPFGVSFQCDVVSRAEQAVTAERLIEQLLLLPGQTAGSLEIIYGFNCKIVELISTIK